jgi:hypothetical protein
VNRGKHTWIHELKRWGDMVKIVALETHQNCKNQMVVEATMDVTVRHYLDDALVLLPLESSGPDTPISEYGHKN